MFKMNDMKQIYVGYCQGKSQSEQLIVQHRPFFDKLQKQLGANESLSSYLIRPIQRLTKYPLMLKVSSYLGLSVEPIADVDIVKTKVTVNVM